MDAGYDDLHSLALAEAETMRVLGFEDPEGVHKKLKSALADPDAVLSSITSSRAEKLSQMLSEGAGEMLINEGQDVEEMQR